MIRVCRAAAISLVGLTFGCSSNPQAESVLPSQYYKIVQIASATEPSQDQDDEVIAHANKLIGQIKNPIVLGRLVSAFQNYDHRIEHDGRCALCERLGMAAESCLGSLSGLGSDAAAKELVRLWTDDKLLWDGGGGLWMGMCITRMGKPALPHLESIVHEHRLSENYTERAKTYIECIHRGEVYGP